MASTIQNKGFLPALNFAGSTSAPILNPSLKFLAGLFPFLFILIFCSAPALPRDEPFDNGANWGGTGLLETPTARVLGDAVMRFGVAQALPFRWYTGAMGVFPALELSARLTQITNIPSGLGPDFGSNKEKALDIKYQVIPESKWLPAIALGYHDLQGTQLFEAQYIVFSKQIFPVDFTLGYGTKRLEGPFAGVEAALHPKLHFLAEYNPVEYEEDQPSVRGVPQGAEWPVNFGLRYKPYPGVHLGLSFQRGDEISLMVHFQAQIGKPFLPHKSDPPPLVPVDQRPFRERDQKEMVLKIHEAIHQAGFTDVTVYTDGQNLTAEFENAKYLFNQKAVGRVLRILLLYAPSDAKKLAAVLKTRRLPMLRVSVKPAHLDKYLLGEVPDEIFERLVIIETVGKSPGVEEKLEIASDSEALLSDWGVKPELTTFLDDPSGFFKLRVGAQPWVTLNLWKGAQFHGNYEVPFYSDINSSNEIVPDAVRSDSFRYLDDDFTFNRLLFDQTVPFTDRLFGRLTLGYLEPMYAGAGGEILHFFRDGRLAFGVESDWARKREPGTQLGLGDLNVHSLLANFYYHFRPFSATLQVQYGRFLAGDVGWLLTGSRELDTGVIIGGWWSFTDTDELTSYNRGYDSKGVFLTLPLRIFLTTDSTKRYTYAVAPWSRDVAATIYHWQTLFGLAGDLMPGKFESRLREIKD